MFGRLGKTELEYQVRLEQTLHKYFAEYTTFEGLDY